MEENKESDLNKELDKIKAKAFMGKNASFLGSILCSCQFTWNKKIKTARTNGIVIQWNPDWFLSLSPEKRETVLIHELWHIARLHILRKGGRDPNLWNTVCDLRINNDMHKDGYYFDKGDYYHDVDAVKIMAEEELYDLLKKDNEPPSYNCSLGNDLDSENGQELSAAQQQQLINTVTNAAAQAKMCGAGSLPGDLEEVINRFLKPVIPWESLLMKYLTDISEESDYTWKRPNRRYQNVYMPSREPDEGALEHLMYFLDVSGSITSEQITRFISEVKYIKEVLNPLKLTLVQFDYGIRKVETYTREDKIDKFHAYGRGGTSLSAVHELIQKEKPTCAVIFSDLECSPMEHTNVPIIWVVIGNDEVTPSFGKTIHIKE